MKKYIYACCLISIVCFTNLFIPAEVSAMAIAPQTCCSSIAFIPGLEGSRLYIPATLFGENQLWEPNRNDDVRKLYMDASGKSIRTDIYTKDIIDESKIGGLNIYKTFEESMYNLVDQGMIREWKAFPYDWRKDISDIVIGGTTIKNEEGNFDVVNMVDEIEKMSKKSISGKVTIVAHSNGGLITKLIIQELEKREKSNAVDRVILVAVPELGTPKAIPALLHGYGQSFAAGFILSESVARGLGQYMQSAFNLLPSREYFNRENGPVVLFDKSADVFGNFSQYGEINSFSGLQDFLVGSRDGRNPSLDSIGVPLVLGKTFLDKSGDTHGSLDNWRYPDNIEVHQIAGWGLDTLIATKYVAKDYCNGSGTLCDKFLDEEPIFSKDGDNTVISSSATAADAENLKTYYINLPEHNSQLLGLRRNRGHADILEIAELQQLIGNIISGNSTLPAIIMTSKPGVDQQLESLRISVHSPVSVDAYDPYGNHTGIINNTNSDSDIQLVEENIPNSSYVNFGEGKYISVPAESGLDVKIQGQDYGTFSLNIESSADNTKTVFADIPVTPLTSARVDSLLGSPQIIMDIDGDGNDDFTVKPNSDFDPVLYLLSIKQTIKSFSLKKNLEKNLFAKIDKLLTLIEKGKIEKVGSKIKKFVFRTENFKKKKMGEENKGVLIGALNELLDNIK